MRAFTGAPALRFWSSIAVGIAAIVLAGCGGGGGGDAPAQPEPAITLSQTTLSFDALREHPTPDEKGILISMSEDVAEIYFAVDVIPEWLDVTGYYLDDSTGNAIFSVTRTDLPKGTYTALVTFYAYDSNANLLATEYVGVTLVVQETVAFARDYVETIAIYGHSTQTQTITATLLAAGESWEVSADQPWISLPAGIQEGSADLAIGIDSSGLALGQYTARIRLVNPHDPTETDELPVFLRVVRPWMTPPPWPFTLGGADGLNEAPKDFAFTLNTGTNAYPWSITHVSYFDMAPAWLDLSKTSGTVGGIGDAFVADALRDLLEPGSYEASLTFRFEVLDEVFTSTVSVRLNIEENRIYVVENGVALYELPSRNRLSAAVNVLSSRDRQDIPWAAESDQAWLSVTPSGFTGEAMDLVADTTALAADTVHVATVTIHSPDAAIENEETVTVALWKGSQQPGDLALNAPFDAVVANPVFPYVHACKADALSSYNIYTGQPVAAPGLPYACEDLAVASDGRTRYVSDIASSAIRGIDLATGDIVETMYRPNASKFGVVRVKGHSFVTPAQPGLTYSFSTDFAAAPHFRRYFEVQDYELGPFSYSGYTIDYSAVRGVTRQSLNMIGGSDTGDARTMALAPDEERFLLSVAGANEFRLYDGLARTRLWTVPALGIPNNTIARADGLLIAGSSVGAESADIQLLNLAGDALGTLSSPAGALLERRMSLTSDTSRLMAPTDLGVIGVLQLPD